jgi:hypothetical protein
VLFGDAGNDLIGGGDGNDRLFGQDGDDFMAERPETTSWTAARAWMCCWRRRE